MPKSQTSSDGPLRLFSVTLFWGAPDSDEGDYTTWVWATDHDAAIRQVAEEMADSNEKSFDSDAGRAEYVEEVIQNAGACAAIQVTDRIRPEIELLMKGPNDQWSPRALRDFDQIKKILARHGGGA